MDDASFHVPLGRHLLSGMVQATRPVWRGLGNLESKILREKIDRTPVDRPIYISGIARAGTTVLTEIIASHPDVVTHQYRDFPFLFIPYWWRQSLDKSPHNETPTERAHGDRLMVTTRSPEAMEEVLWMTFFDHLHDPASCNALDARMTNLRFEAFYRDHLRKLLLISGRARYAAKGNYNLTRCAYLLRIFPDARFVIVIRSPREHIASLMKQHQIFTRAAGKYPRSVAHLRRVGHFEFGAHRRCINPFSDGQAVESIETLWSTGQQVRGWARYWAMLYGWLADTLDKPDSASLRAATLVLRYEDLCDKPVDTLKTCLDHCRLGHADLLERWPPQLTRPTYYEAKYLPEEEQAIEEETRSVAARFGYR